MTFELPAGLAEPLHILEPTWQKAVAFILLALSLALTLWLLRRWRRRAAAPAEAPPQPPSPSAPARAPSGIDGAVRALRDEYRTRRREGCHELSVLLRAHFERRAGSRRSRRSFATLTAREVGRLLGKEAVREHLLQLSDLQFRRHEPSEREFDRICDRSVEVARVRL